MRNDRDEIIRKQLDTIGDLINITLRQCYQVNSIRRDHSEKSDPEENDKIVKFPGKYNSE